MHTKLNTYIKAIIFLVIYILFTRALFISMVLLPNKLIAFTVEIISPTVFGITFLYFFLHKDIFKFAKVIIEKKKKTEEKLISKFLRFGSIGASIIICFIAGPLFCALTVYLLLSDFKYKYYLVAASCGTSSFLALALARGILHLAIRLV